METDAMDENIAVIGAGAVGGVTAGLMKAAGWDPILVCKHHCDDARGHGGGRRHGHPGGAGGGRQARLVPAAGRRRPAGGWRRDLLIRIIGFKYRRIRSSSLQSLEQGRPTEIDFLNGYICDRALDHGVPAPVNEAVVGLVHQIQYGRRPISPANLDDPLLTRPAGVVVG